MESSLEKSGRTCWTRSREEAEKRANHRSFHAGDAFYVPSEARWTHLRDEVHYNLGDGAPFFWSLRLPAPFGMWIQVG